MTYNAKPHDLKKHLRGRDVAAMRVCQDVIYLVKDWYAVIVMHLMICMSN